MLRLQHYEFTEFITKSIKGLVGKATYYIVKTKTITKRREHQINFELIQSRLGEHDLFTD